MTVYQVADKKLREAMMRLGLPTVFDPDSKEPYQLWWIHSGTVTISTVVAARVEPLALTKVEAMFPSEAEAREKAEELAKKGITATVTWVVTVDDGDDWLVTWWEER